MGKFLDIARTILSQEKRPLRVKEIIELAREKGYLDFSEGETPHQTIKARISEDIVRKKNKSDFKRVVKGVFALRDFEGREYDARPFIKRIKKSEGVLVFNRKTLNELGYFNGIKTTGLKKYLDQIVNKKNSFFLPRIEAEKDTNHKQILSYVLVQKNKSLLRFVRGVYTNAHSMLRGSFCIGFGGHVQDYDVNLFELLSNDNGYKNSVIRELVEELRIPESSINKSNFKVIGILNDDSSEVGKSHFAIIHKLNIDHLKIKNVKDLKGEKSINQLTIVPIAELGDDFEKYEYWSKLCIKKFYNSSNKIDCKIHRIKNYALAKHPEVIIITGAIGSGKTEASKILEKEFGYKYISSGRVLQEIMESAPIEKIGRKHFQDLALKFISTENGPNQLALKLVETINNNSASKYVIDGIRNIRTYEILKSMIGANLTLIFVESTPDNCYKFYEKREGKIDILSFFEYLDHAVERDIKVILGKANLVVYNHGSLSSFQSQIKKYFKFELKKNE